MLCLSVLLPYYTHRFNRFGAGVVQVVKLVAQQMLLLIRIRIGVTHSIIPEPHSIKPVVTCCQPVVYSEKTGTPMGDCSTFVLW